MSVDGYCFCECTAFTLNTCRSYEWVIFKCCMSCKIGLLFEESGGINGLLKAPNPAFPCALIIYSPAKLYCSQYPYRLTHTTLLLPNMYGWWSLRFWREAVWGSFEGWGLTGSVDCAGESINDAKPITERPGQQDGDRGGGVSSQREAVSGQTGQETERLWRPLFIKILYSELFSSVVMSEFARALHVLLSGFLESEETDWNGGCSFASQASSNVPGTLHHRVLVHKTKLNWNRAWRLLEV